MGSLKTRLIVRNDVEISAKVRTSEALARRVCQNPRSPNLKSL